MTNREGLDYRVIRFYRWRRAKRGGSAALSGFQVIQEVPYLAGEEFGAAGQVLY
jgi:hypothetical protein